MKYRKILLASMATAAATCTQSAAAPRLVVQVVVSQMRYDCMERFGANFSQGGFKRFMDEGVVFTDARYEYMLTGTAAGLATITTGSQPSTHGIVGERWADYISGTQVCLADDKTVKGLHCDESLGCFSPVNLTVPTLGDRLTEDSPESKVVTVAATPSSAIVMGGFSGEAYWCDASRGTWISSTHYMAQLPGWVAAYNEVRPANRYLSIPWELSRAAASYANKRSFVAVPGRVESINKKISRNYPALYSTPWGNTLVADFARMAIENGRLGEDEHTDLLNICFDCSRTVCELYGPESVEVEDMFYRLDADLARLLEAIYARVDRKDVIVVLTSDHGASDSYDRQARHRERFNIPQFKVILNSFMNAQWGEGDWVLDYSDRQIYLNRDLAYKKGLNLQQIQERVAAFALQFRGVSHAMTATALSNSAFGFGYGRYIQNGFYPRRSGDVVINLMPGWIEDRDGVRSLSGSMYEYDTHVPLMLLAGSSGPQRIRAPTDMARLAPTLARMMQIGRPVAATGAEITALTQQATE